MFRNLKFVLRKHNCRKSIKNITYYHTENGVYGYIPKNKNVYKVPDDCIVMRAKYSNFYRLVTAYREHAHKSANTNPITLEKPEKLIELDPQQFGLKLDDTVEYYGILNIEKKQGTVEDALKILESIYTSEIGAEFTYLESQEEREWFSSKFEKLHEEKLTQETKKSIASEMMKSQTLDNFLAKKFVSIKRYGCEGAESMMAFFQEFFELCGKDGLEQVIACMPHRGRLNFLIGMLKFPPEKLFRKLKGLSEFPDDVKATGDVASHFISSIDLDIKGKSLHVTLLHNPSHLEAVNSVSMGKTRGVMQAVKDGAYCESRNRQWSDKVINVQVHGDAAYAGQGVNQESLALSKTPHFEIGGTIHLVINNQLGFTTPPSRGRSSRYCTDLAKFISAPVLHVNGDAPEMLVKATRIAFEYQRKYRKDVFIDLNCFRRWGHNEMDEPTFTNPLLYKIINNRQSIPDVYRQKLEKMEILKTEESEEIIRKYTNYLEEAFKKSDKYVPQATYFSGRWAGFQQAKPTLTTWETGVDVNLIKFVVKKSVERKENLKIHPTLIKSHIQTRIKKLDNGEYLDWSMAETAAFGTLMYQGFNVRLSGQDVGRGTFSQRHMMLVDQSTGEIYIPLNSMIDNQMGKIELANSILSEEAVVGYEYGVSISSPTTLTIWEAQFGDFFNGAQIMIDTFLSSGETKWMMNSGLTLLLPHGYDGAGPEHSSCRLERFLQLTDSNENSPDGDNINVQVTNPTTPAQYFHLLRRQMIRYFRKPLVIVSPKILLRHPSATSSLDEMSPGTSFKNIIGDDVVEPDKIEKIIFVSGKHYYALEQQRKKLATYNTAIIRIECLCPFPLLEINEEIKKFPNTKSFVWSQEEPRNMGAWTFIKPRFENLCGRQIKYCGRDTLATPAVGIGKLHQQEALEVIEKPFIMK